MLRSILGRNFSPPLLDRDVSPSAATSDDLGHRRAERRRCGGRGDPRVAGLLGRSVQAPSGAVAAASEAPDVRCVPWSGSRGDLRRRLGKRQRARLGRVDIACQRYLASCPDPTSGERSTSIPRTRVVTEVRPCRSPIVHVRADATALVLDAHHLASGRGPLALSGVDQDVHLTPRGSRPPAPPPPRRLVDASACDSMRSASSSATRSESALLRRLVVRIRIAGPRAVLRPRSREPAYPSEMAGRHDARASTVL